jgi:dienelactone hydrolase
MAGDDFSLAGRMSFVHAVANAPLGTIAAAVNIRPAILCEFLAGDAHLGAPALIALCAVYRHSIAVRVDLFQKEVERQRVAEHEQALARRRHVRERTAQELARRREQHKLNMQLWRARRQQQDAALASTARAVASA